MARISGLGLAAEAARAVADSGNVLHCLLAELNTPLALVEPPPGLEGLPLALAVPSLGEFRDLRPRLDWLRSLNLRVYLPCDRPENISALRALASLGIAGCAVIAPGENDWEALADLMVYALLERCPHASIEPFAGIAGQDAAGAAFDWAQAYFDSPRRYLHLDGNGRVALSRDDLDAGRWIADNLDAVGDPRVFPPIKERLSAWRRFFLANHACAYCRGFAICRGRFSGEPEQTSGCADFFIELIEALRQLRSRRLAVLEQCAWRP